MLHNNDVGVGEGTLDQYLLGRYNAPAGSRAGKFRPIGTCDDEVCLFPVTATLRLCAVVASMFARSLTTYAYDSTALLRSTLLNRNEREETEEIPESKSIMRYHRSEMMQPPP